MHDDVWTIGDGPDVMTHLEDDLRAEQMARQKHNTATIILANGEEIQRVVKVVSDGGQYQQGDVVRYGQKIPVYRDLSVNPFWFEDKELPEQVEAKMQGLTVQKYPNGSTVKVNGMDWTIDSMSRDSEGLLPGQADRGEDYNLYRLSRHNTRSILRWQYEIDAENCSEEE